MKAAIHHLLNELDFNEAFVEQLLAGVEAELDAPAGAGLENHPAWTIGHLIMASARLRRSFGAALDVPQGWPQLFDRSGPGDASPIPEGPFPDASTLLAEYKRQNQALRDLFAYVSESDWNAPVQWRFDAYFQTKGELAQFILIAHTNMHLGQLSAWRRAKQKPSALNAVR